MYLSIYCLANLLSIFLMGVFILKWFFKEFLKFVVFTFFVILKNFVLEFFMQKFVFLMQSTLNFFVEGNFICSSAIFFLFSQYCFGKYMFPAGDCK